MAPSHVGQELQMTPSTTYLPPPADWVVAIAGGLVCLSLVLDGLLAKRYAGGNRHADAATCRLLVLSLSSNIVIGFACVAMPFGRLGGPSALLAIGGLTLATGGLGLRYAAIWQLGRFFTWQVSILNDHQLITTGIFRWVRHPSYCGGLAAAAGILLALGNGLPMAVFAAVHLPLVLWRIRVEEAALLTHFGDTYRRYMGASWRLLPGVY